jgi:hypothetical protein
MRDKKVVGVSLLRFRAPLHCDACKDEGQAAAGICLQWETQVCCLIVMGEQAAVELSTRAVIGAMPDGQQTLVDGQRLLVTSCNEGVVRMLLRPTTGGWHSMLP